MHSVSLKDIKAWMSSVNFKISNNKLQKRYQVCAVYIKFRTRFCDKLYLLIVSSV